MRINRILILLLILATMLQAAPRHKIRTPHRPRAKYVQVYHPAYRVNMWVPYRQRMHYSPAVVTRTVVTKTVTPDNLVVLTAEDIATDIETLNATHLRGLITEKDYTSAKKTLLNRIGMSVNPDAPGMSVSEIVGQIEILNELQSEGTIAAREYKKQKNKLLDMI